MLGHQDDSIQDALLSALLNADALFLRLNLALAAVIVLTLGLKTLNEREKLRVLLEALEIGLGGGLHQGAHALHLLLDGRHSE